MEVIRLAGVTKRFGSTVALDNLDLTVAPGEVRGFLGPNGAGKSTTIRLVLGMLRADAGTAELFGRDPWADAAELHRRLAYVPSEANLWPSLTGAEALAFLGNVHGSVDEKYRDELVERFELLPDKKTRAYSHGNRQKVPLIAALAALGAAFLIDPVPEDVFTPEDFNDEQRAMARTVAEFIDREVLPRLAEIEEKQEGVVPSLLRRAGELSLLAIEVPEAYGGLGLDKAPALLVSERAAKVASFSVSWGAHMDITRTFVASANEPIADGARRLVANELAAEELAKARTHDRAARPGPTDRNHRGEDADRRAHRRGRCALPHRVKGRPVEEAPWGLTPTGKLARLTP